MDNETDELTYKTSYPADTENSAITSYEILNSMTLHGIGLIYIEIVIPVSQQSPVIRPVAKLLVG